MQSSPGADQPIVKGKRSEDGDGRSAVRRQTFERITTSDNATVQLGDRYHHHYYGLTHHTAASGTGITGGIPELKVTDALKFDGMDLRRASIKLAYGSTCQWFFDSPEYKTWRDSSFSVEHHGFLWIRGKPGAGKSTLMRLAVKHADQEFPSDLRIAFFFNAKGTLLERSVEGMYRALLYQLLTQYPKLERVVRQGASNHSIWTVELLEEYFRDCVLQLGSLELTCHIDALDECEEHDVRGLIEFFEDLGGMALSAGVQLHVCLASRHYPYISMSKAVYMVIDSLQGHQDDIETYVHGNLKVLEPALRGEIAKEIRTRARDVFLWVVLVVRLLNRESDLGNNHSLRAHLGAVPDSLYQLFEDAVLKRGADDNHYLLPTLLWILFAKQPLTPAELYHAVLYTNGNPIDAAILEDAPSPSQIARFILNTTKGLAEITVRHESSYGPEVLRVQFIHETVRDYLRDTGICRLEGSIRTNPIGMSNEILKTRCVEYLSFFARNLHLLERLLGPLSGPLYPSIRRHIRKEFPFLLYAVSGAVIHAETAQAHDVSQVAFLEAFPLDLLISVSRCGVNEFPNEYQSKYQLSPSVTKPYLFALFNAPKLLQLELSGGGRFRSQVNVDADSMACKDIATPTRQGYWGDPLIAAVWAKNTDTVRLLLQHDFDVNVKGGQYGTAIETAFASNNEDMIRLLLEYGVDVNARISWRGLTPRPILHVVAEWGLFECVRILVEHGADVNAGSEQNDTALMAAVKSAELEKGQQIVGFLIEQGAHDDNPERTKEYLASREILLPLSVGTNWQRYPASIA
jgi:energy-coupling factor transporter ATP-binding protein EcfA2